MWAWIERIDLVDRVEAQGIGVSWRGLGREAPIGEPVPQGMGAEPIELEVAGARSGSGPSTPFHPRAFRRRGIQDVVAAAHPVHDTTLIEGRARAFYLQHPIDAGRMGSGADMARAEGLDQSGVNVLPRLALLAPDIVERIMAGTQPRTLCLWWLQRWSSVPMRRGIHCGRTRGLRRPRQA